MKPQELFDALERGEKIEGRPPHLDVWVVWNGAFWHKEWEFRIIKPEPVLVPHWPAVVHSNNNTSPFVGNTLFATENDAKKVHVVGFVRLATEYPPILLEVKS